jgi:hypothetical protein
MARRTCVAGRGGPGAAAPASPEHVAITPGFVGRQAARAALLDELARGTI